MYDAKYVECASYDDDKDCSDDMIGATFTVAEMKHRLTILGWVKDKERGWVCPKCAKQLKARATRTKAKR